MNSLSLTARIRSTLIAITGSAALLALPAHANEKWNLYIYNAVATVSAVKGLNKVTEEIEKETGRALSVRLHLGGSLPINTTTITPAVSDDMRRLYVALTRANQVWRAPIQADGTISKMGALQTFFGPTGPDGLAVDRFGRLLVAHPSLDGVFVLHALGEVAHHLRSPLPGSAVTNVACWPGRDAVVMTESLSGSVLVAQLPPS